MGIVEQIVLHVNENDFDKAMTLISENEPQYKENVEFLTAKAMLCMKTGEDRTAINILKKAIQIDPDNNDLYYNLSYAYETLDNKCPIEELNENPKNIIVKKYLKRISHEKSQPMPSRSESAASLIEPDAPLVSIILLAYNKLDYTKQCVESIFKYTDDVDYELIMVDNGSTDDTFEYFKSINKIRVVRLFENQGASVGFNEGIKAARGKYIAGVCNDFIFTKNWLSNLVKCIESDESIGYVSPGSSFISNLQQINLNFSNLEEMQVEAAKYNVSDPQKWEERIRLLPNVLFVRREVLDIVGYYDAAFYYGEFADDDLCFRIRRAGYKLIYCGDTFTHHHGHVTGGADQKENNSLELSRRLFVEKNRGVDTWNDVKYDKNLIRVLKFLNCAKGNKIKVLGIDVRCGNSLLMAKNKLKHEGFSDVELYAYVQNPIYYQDLKTICKDVYVGNMDNIENVFEASMFDYIIIDEPINSYCNVQEVLHGSLSLLKQSGQAIVSLLNGEDINNISQMLTNKYVQNAMIKSNFSVSSLIEYAQKTNFNKVDVLNELHSMSEKDNEAVEDMAKKICLDGNVEAFISKLKTYRYCVSLMRG